MIAIPMARKQAAASKGDTGPRFNESTRKFPNNPAIMATRPFPTNIALEKVSESHWESKPLCTKKASNILKLHKNILD